MNSATSELTQATYMTTKMLKGDFLLRNTYPEEVSAGRITCHASPSEFDPGNRMNVRGEKRLRKVVLCPPHMRRGTCAPALMHTQQQ